MKKIIVSLFTLALVCGFSSIVFAANGSRPVDCNGTLSVTDTYDLFVVDGETRYYFGHLNEETSLVLVENGQEKNITPSELMKLGKKSLTVKASGQAVKTDFPPSHEHRLTAPEYFSKPGRILANCTKLTITIIADAIK